MRVRVLVFDGAQLPMPFLLLCRAVNSAVRLGDPNLHVFEACCSAGTAAGGRPATTLSISSAKQTVSPAGACHLPMTSSHGTISLRVPVARFSSKIWQFGLTSSVVGSVSLTQFGMHAGLIWSRIFAAIASSAAE